MFFFFPPEDAPRESLQQWNKLKSDTVRWIFDPKAKTDSRVKPAQLFGISGEFSRSDDRFVTKKYNHFWQLQIDPTRPYDFQKCGSPAGGLFNAIGHFTWDEGTKDVYWAGPTTTFQEPVFMPKITDIEGDGYLMCLLNHLDELRNDVLIFDALNLAKGPLAIVHLSCKLRVGLHGNFVDQREIEAWQELRKESGELGPVKPATKPLPWQERLIMNGMNGATGTHGTNGTSGMK